MNVCVWYAAAGFEERVVEWHQPRIHAASPANGQRIFFEPTLQASVPVAAFSQTISRTSMATPRF